MKKKVAEEVGEALRLATEARRDYETVHADERVKAAVRHFKRDTMELRLLRLHDTLLDNWKELSQGAEYNE